MTQDILDTQQYVSSTCLSLLLSEIVPTSIRVSHRLKESSNDTPLQQSKSSEDESLARAEHSIVQTKIDQQLSTIPGDLPGTVTVLDSPTIHHDDVTIRIETYGYNLGLRLSEVLMYKASNPAITSNNNPKIVDILDIMKFVCRDVWKCLYHKQMDNLRTNHRGTFVLVDNNYRPIASLNSAKGVPDTIHKAKAYLWFPCGIIRGILMSFGVDANVTAEITQFPAITFNIQTTINN